ncbi:C45 family peptidase [Eubacterium sp. 1001713B170207_170306_E7]|uniref:C45 family autoproteolytic acyltransferase/hydolase n=1 Tax=Eubacterium sp. 1001713B170207_170306_E7 TaxID=2787097 RepID=UPI001896DEA4|nr:C45 family peptidase [Eubacterium sp. 1001713B170207_170306_E7]
MYHNRFKGNHYDMGFRWGAMLRKHGRVLLDTIDFPITQERLRFAAACVPICRQYFPELLEEIQGLADGQGCAVAPLHAFLFSMYAMPPACHCSCFAVASGDQVLFGRNSDFLVALEKSNTNAIYRFGGGAFDFTGNSTAFIQMEDGVNDQGLAVGLTAVYPHAIRPGLNAGVLLRYFLEKCQSTSEVIGALRELPVSSAQTFTVADRSGDISVLEVNCDRMEVLRPMAERPYVCATNLFHSRAMSGFCDTSLDNWEAEPRYQTLTRALDKKAARMDLAGAMALLSGRDGFICQYDRKTGKDTVWSVVYDLKRAAIYRTEGNPGRKKFREDRRFSF